MTQPAEHHVTAIIRTDGYAQVVLDGVPHVTQCAGLDEARQQVVGLVQERLVTPSGRPVIVDVDDPQGPTRVTVNPDGSVTEGPVPETALSEDTIPPGQLPALREEAAAAGLDDWGPPDERTVQRSVVTPTEQPSEPEVSVASWMRSAAGTPARPQQAQPPVVPQQSVPQPSAPPIPQPSPPAQPAGQVSEPPAAPQPYSPPAQPHAQPPAPAQPAPLAAGWGAEATPPMTRRQMRESFLRTEQVEAPASKGFRGALSRVGIRTQPSAAEREERDDVHAVSQHWPGVRTIAVVNGKGGAGKALAVDEPVLTPTGYRAIGTLETGDLVIGSDGLPYPVLGVYPQGERDLYAVTFTDGTTIQADAEHLWAVHATWDRLRDAECSVDGCARTVLAKGYCNAHYKQQWRGNPLRVSVRTGSYSSVAREESGERLMTTAQLALAGPATDRPGHGIRHRFFVKVATAVKLSPADLPLDPYLLGVLLGDGSLSHGSVSVSSADQPLLDAVRAALPVGVTMRHHSHYDHRIVRSASGGTNPLIEALRDLGLYGARSEHKFVPEVYQAADLDARLSILQGLLDTDGHADTSGGAVFVSTSRRLADDVKHLAETLGCVVTRHTPHRPSYQHNGERRIGQLAHSVHIVAPAGLALFRLERKQSRAAARRRAPLRAIASIVPSGRGEAVCISVASPDHLFLARNCVPTHNTPTTALLAATFARYSGAATIAWDNNETRGTLGWRTEQGKHENTVLDLIPRTDELLDPGARAGDISHYVHHQAADKYDVLRSNPHLLSAEQRIGADDVDSIHDVLGRYYRLIFVDSGNDESAGHWLRMIDKADQLVVPTIARPEHAEAGALLLEELVRRGGRSAELARRAVVVVSQSREKDADPPAAEIARGFADWVSAVVTIPYDRAMVESVLHFDALSPATRRAWLRAAAAVARQL